MKGMVIPTKNENVAVILVVNMLTTLAVVVCLLFDCFLPDENSFLGFLNYKNK